MITNASAGGALVEHCSVLPPPGAAVQLQSSLGGQPAAVRGRVVRNTRSGFAVSFESSTGSRLHELIEVLVARMGPESDELDEPSGSAGPIVRSDPPPTDPPPRKGAGPVVPNRIEPDDDPLIGSEPLIDDDELWGADPPLDDGPKSGATCDFPVLRGEHKVQRDIEEQLAELGRLDRKGRASRQ